MTKTKIEWTEHSWNPITGCTPISEGCRNCYAKRMARRLAGRLGYPEAPHHFDVTLHPDKLDVPRTRKRPTTYFVCSMSDLFHGDVPDDFILDVLIRCGAARQHTFQILTKRPARMFKWWTEYMNGAAFPQNVWLGVSVENQAAADERIPLLLQTQAVIRFVSAEPLLEAVDLENYLGIWTNGVVSPRQPLIVNEPMTPNLFTALARPKDASLYKQQLNWVICGGESGPGARPMDVKWARSLVEQCGHAGVPIFVKQMGTAWARDWCWGGKTVSAHGDRKGANMMYWPEDLRVRQFPGR